MLVKVAGLVLQAMFFTTPIPWSPDAVAVIKTADMRPQRIDVVGNSNGPCGFVRLPSACKPIMDAQSNPQRPAQRSAHLYRPGQSGNPSGRTRMLDRIDDLFAEFQRVHGREPSPMDMIGIRTAARLAAACASPNTNAEQAVRAGNTLHKTLKRLGLASPPAKRAGKSPLQSLDDHLAATHGGSR
jgi:hypothetical protein